MKKSSQQLNSLGFTLIEILVAIVLMSIIMAMIIYPFISSTGYLAKARARSEVQQVARDVLDTMDREISEAMDIYLLPADPSICAFVPAQPNTFPVQPSNKIIRYWLVWGSNPNANNSGVIPADSPISKSWYEKFSTDPRLNQATADDTDSRYIARTEFNYSSAGGALDLNGLSDAKTLNRAAPVHQYDPLNPDPYDLIADREKFVALTPDEPNFDIPILRITPTPQINETLQVNGTYIFKSKYPLWEGAWSITVYTPAGAIDTAYISPNPFTAASIPAGVGVDLYTGRVSFISSKTDTINITVPNTPQPLTYLPLTDSEVVTIGSEIFSRVAWGITPSGSQYAIDPVNNRIIFDPALTPSGTITYQYARIPANYIVMASYSTRALLNISITASKRDTQSGLPQTISLQQKVKLKNVVR